MPGHRPRSLCLRCLWCEDDEDDDGCDRLVPLPLPLPLLVPPSPCRLPLLALAAPAGAGAGAGAVADSLLAGAPGVGAGASGTPGADAPGIAGAGIIGGGIAGAGAAGAAADDGATATAAAPGAGAGAGASESAVSAPGVLLQFACVLLVGVDSNAAAVLAGALSSSRSAASARSVAGPGAIVGPPRSPSASMLRAGRALAPVQSPCGWMDGLCLYGSVGCVGSCVSAWAVQWGSCRGR